MLIGSGRVHAVSAGDLFLGVEFAPPARELFGAFYSRDIVVIELPRRVRAPAQRRLHRGLCAGADLQQSEVPAQGSMFENRIARLTGGITERKVAEQKPRHGGVLHDVLGRAHHDGRNAARLEVPRHQGDGLMADGAVRHQHAASTLSARQRAKISGASVSIVMRWLRLVGAPKKRGATAPIRPAAANRSNCGSGNQVPLSSAEVWVRS